MQSKFLTTTQAGHVLGCSRNHVKKLISRGELPAHRVGVEYRIEQAAVEALLAALRGDHRPAQAAS